MIALSPAVQRRALSGAAPTTLHFYTNRQLELYSGRKANKLSLRQLVFFGRAMNEERLIKSANYVRTELPVRMAHRIRDLQSLPYVVVTEKNMWGVYEAYRSAFERFRSYPEVHNMEENEQFCQFLSGLLKEHLPMIPQLSLALSISSPHLAPDELDSFMRRMLISRISRRVLVEHHVALTQGFCERKDDPDAPKHVGIIYTNLSVKDSINKCICFLKSEEGMYGLRRLEEPTLRGTGIWPEIIVDGHLDAKFPYIKEHLEYIIFELLKNAIRMTALRMKNDPEHVPGVITATIAADENSVNVRITDQGGGLLLPENQHPSNLFSFSHLRNATRMNEDRLSALHRMTEDGFPITIADQVTRWKARQQQLLEKEKTQTQGANASNEEENGINRMGLGLPLSNTYARYFGGSLDLVSLDGWGVDVYLRLPRLGTTLENIEI